MLSYDLLQFVFYYSSYQTLELCYPSFYYFVRVHIHSLKKGRPIHIHVSHNAYRTPTNISSENGIPTKADLRAQ